VRLLCNIAIRLTISALALAFGVSVAGPVSWAQRQQVTWEGSIDTPEPTQFTIRAQIIPGGRIFGVMNIGSFTSGISGQIMGNQCRLTTTNGMVLGVDLQGQCGSTGFSGRMSGRLPGGQFVNGSVQLSAPGQATTVDTVAPPTLSQSGAARSDRRAPPFGRGSRPMAAMRYELVTGPSGPYEAWNEGKLGVVRVFGDCASRMKIDFRASPDHGYLLDDPERYAGIIGGLFNEIAGGNSCARTPPRELEVYFFRPEGNFAFIDVLKIRATSAQWSTLTLAGAQWTSAKEYAARPRLTDPSSFDFSPGNSKKISEMMRFVYAEAQDKEAACRRQFADLRRCEIEGYVGLTPFIDGIVSTAQKSLAAIPVSYDGFRALGKMREDYQNFLGSLKYGNYDMVAAARPLILPAISDREKAMFEQLKPQLLKEMESQGFGLINDLFPKRDDRWLFFARRYFDPGKVRLLEQRLKGGTPFFRRNGQDTRSAREKSASSNVASWGPPTGEEMALAFMRSMRQMGGGQATPNVIRIPGPFGSGSTSGPGLDLQMYHMEPLQCRKGSRGYYCAYAIYAQVIDTSQMMEHPLARFLPALTEAPFPSYAVQLFVPTQNGWTMPELQAQLADNYAKMFGTLSAGFNATAEIGRAMARVGDDDDDGPNNPLAKQQRDRQRQNEAEEQRKRRQAHGTGGNDSP
jgi:hypothetical protein